MRAHVRNSENETWSLEGAVDIVRSYIKAIVEMNVFQLFKSLICTRKKGTERN